MATATILVSVPPLALLRQPEGAPSSANLALPLPSLLPFTGSHCPQPLRAPCGQVFDHPSSLTRAQCSSAYRLKHIQMLASNLVPTITPAWDAPSLSQLDKQSAQVQSPLPAISVLLQPLALTMLCAIAASKCPPLE